MAEVEEKPAQREKIIDGTYLYKDNTIDNPTGLSILVGTRDVGPVRALLPLVESFPAVKSLFFLADRAAREELLRRKSLID